MAKKATIKAISDMQVPTVEGTICSNLSDKIIESYSSINSISRSLGDDLKALCLELAKEVEDNKNNPEWKFPATLNEFNRVGEHIMKIDPKLTRLTSIGIKRWLEEVAGFVVTNRFMVRTKPAESGILYDRDWGLSLRDAPDWDKHLAAQTKVRSFENPQDKMVRMLAEWHFAGGIDEDQLREQFPKLAGRVLSELKDPKVLDKLEFRKEELEKKGIALRK